MRFNQYSEMQGYLYDLKRFRPILKVQSFIDMRRKLKKLPPDVEAKRKAVIKDWWKLILWYIRIRRAAKGNTPEALI